MRSLKERETERERLPPSCSRSFFIVKQPRRCGCRITTEWPASSSSFSSGYFVLLIFSHTERRRMNLTRGVPWHSSDRKKLKSNHLRSFSHLHLQCRYDPRIVLYVLLNTQNPSLKELKRKIIFYGETYDLHAYETPNRQKWKRWGEWRELPIHQMSNFISTLKLALQTGMSRTARAHTHA